MRTAVRKTKDEEEEDGAHAFLISGTFSLILLLWWLEFVVLLSINFRAFVQRRFQVLQASGGNSHADFIHILIKVVCAFFLFVVLFAFASLVVALIPALQYALKIF